MSGKSGMRNSGSGIAVRGGAAARSAAGTTQRVKFGDVVREVKDKIDRADNPYEFYVAGDHMDTEDLKIRRRGRFATDDVGPAFTRVFKPGQILYGSRRTYLKKVCVADFEGITANTTFVLETKDDNVLLQRLLPFLMLGDRFTAWSIKHSKGSTNPYVLFGDLADYEFDLPPMDEQKKLAELLWAANDLKESYKKAITATDGMLKAKFREMFGGAGDASRGAAESRSSQSKWPMARFDDVAPSRLGKMLDARKQTGKWLRPYLANVNVQWFHFDLSDLREMDFNEEDQREFALQDGDLLVCEGGEVGRCAIWHCELKECYFQKAIHRVRCDKKKLIPEYVAFWFLTQSQKGNFAKEGKGTTIAHLPGEKLKELRIPLPPLSLQREFVAIADKAESAKANLKKSIAAIDQVMKGLIYG